jgi:hypothetical protein
VIQNAIQSYFAVPLLLPSFAPYRSRIICLQSALVLPTWDMQRIDDCR